MTVSETSGHKTLPSGRDLRTRYIPRARIRPVYLQAAPWLDLLFILFFLVLAQSRIVLRPGVVVTLPSYGGMGVEGGGIAVLVPEHRGGQQRAKLFFDDEVFALDSPARAAELATRFSAVRSAEPLETLTLYADRRVSQAYVMQVMNLATEAGFTYLNLGAAPPAGNIP